MKNPDSTPKQFTYWMEMGHPLGGSVKLKVVLREGSDIAEITQAYLTQEPTQKSPPSIWLHYKADSEQKKQSADTQVIGIDTVSMLRES